MFFAFIFQYKNFIFQIEDGADYDVYINLANCHNELNEYQKAMQYNSLPIQEEETTVALLLRGEIFLSLEQYENAVLAYDEVIKEDTSNIEAYFYRGWAKSNLED